MRKFSLLSVFAMALGLVAATGCNQPKNDSASKGEAAKTADQKAKAKSGDAPAPGKVAKGDSTIIPVGTSFAKGGGADALVTIIEFSDFQCPFCTRVNPTLKQIKETYGDKVRVVFKHNPLPFHKDAPGAAYASLAAGMQGKFWPMHDKLFENQRALKRADLVKYAKELELDVQKFEKDMDAKGTKAMVDADQALAKKVGARGTPNFLINGKQISGARPFDSFKQVIDSEIKAIEDGKIAANAAYATRVKSNFKKPTPRKAKGPDTKTVYKIPTGDVTYAKGGKAPLVTILEFSEFQCPFCSKVLPTMKKIHETYGDDVRVVFKHNPLSFHKDAKGASLAALAAGKQGKFWEMHDKMFANQRKLKTDNLNAYAQELGLDMAKFKADMADASLAKIIADDQKIAAQFGARGTPNFFINGRQLTGARPYPSFKEVIDAEIKKANALIKAGTARADIYTALTAKGLTKAAPRAKKNARKPRADDKTVYKVPVGANDMVKGPADALITVIEFSEFQCPFCSRVNPTIAQVNKTYGKDVRVVFKHNPLPFHKDAPLAAEAALAANAQGKGWEMHDKLFQNQKQLKRESLNAYAKELGLNVAKFGADLDSGKFKAQIKADQALARQIGASGTPHFFVNGRRLVGAQPFPSFKTLIDGELAKAKALVAKGTARANVYTELTKNGATKPAAGTGRKAPEDDKKVYNVKVNPGDAMKGNKNAQITIVEFSDFQCPFCGRVNPTLKQIQDTYGDKVRIVFKHNPLSFHKDAPLASEAALAANAQGKFWEYHDLLFKNQRAIKRDNLDSYAQELGLNMAKFKKDLDAGTYKAQIVADQAMARSLGATGTPSFFVNGRKLRGAQPFPKFKALIDEQLKKK